MIQRYPKSFLFPINFLDDVGLMLLQLLIRSSHLRNYGFAHIGQERFTES